MKVKTAHTYAPPAGFHFKVQFDLPGASGDTPEGNFQEVSGINASLGTEPYSEGGENRFSHRLPTRAEYGTLTLKRGMMPASNLRDWFERAIYNLDIEPVEVRVILMDPASNILATWSFIRAYPTKWDVSGFNAMGGDLVVENIELVYQYFRRVN